MPVKNRRKYRKKPWQQLRASILSGSYRPSLVLRVAIPKPGGGERYLGIPTVRDRFIQQAIMQVLQPRWEASFSAYSYGFRPERSAHDAIGQAQRYIRQGYSWVIDLVGMEKFFDHVNHDLLMRRVRAKVFDRQVLRLINLYRRSGVVIGEVQHETPEGTPQGSPLSPLLANVLLDSLDKELEKRGLRFVRYADDCNGYVRSQCSAKRVLSSLSRFLVVKLKVKVNRQKSAVGRVWERPFLDFSFSRTLRSRVSEKSLKRFKQLIRELTRRTRDRTIRKIIEELRRYILGWKAYYGLSQYRSLFKEVDSWIHRKLRCYQWKQWGRRGYKELRRRGVRRD